MPSKDSLQRHVCALFLTSALLTSLVIMSKKSPVKLSYKHQNPGNSSSPSPLPENSFSFGHSTRRKSETLHILGLFELSTKWGARPQGLSEVAAAELAIKHINHLNLLPHYTLNLIVNDTKCDPGVGIDRFFHAIYSPKKILMLLGSSCSNVTQSLAHIVPYWNILQISFGSTAPTLSDRKKFPLFFRTVAPDSSHNIAKVAFVNYYNWKAVATFCQSENEYLLPINKLITDFEEKNISCLTTVTFSIDNYKEQLKVLKNSDVRIILGAFSTDIAPLVFCEVNVLGMYGDDYVWILHDRGVQWWNYPKRCSSTRLQTSVNGLILVSDYNIVIGNNQALAGMNNQLFERTLNLPVISQFASLTYDAIWAIALSLKELPSSFGKEFNYKRRDIVNEVMSRMSSLDFMGISGPLRFIGADRIGSSILRQLQNGHIRDIAVFDSYSSQLDFFCKSCRRISWWNRDKPIARRILRKTIIKVPKFLLYSIIFLASLGILFALLFLYFNLHFRKLKTVKLSSPKLNNLAVAGCILVYLYVILLGLDTSTIDEYVNELCTIRVYLLSAGFSLAFGSMFAKTYRVHRIFATAPCKLTDFLLKDKQLIVLLLTPLLIDALILTLWVMIDPLQRQLYNLTLEINSLDRGVVYQPQIQVCRSRNTSGWFVALYGYKGLILIMGVFMAWETRHVKIQALNDSQYIGICVYCAVFSAIITGLTSFIDHIILRYLAQALSILTSTTLTLFLLFLPKLKAVFSPQQVQDPVMQSMGLKIECNTRRFINNDPREQIFRLEIQNKVFKCELAALDAEITRLENLLGSQEIYTIHGNLRASDKKINDYFPVVKEISSVFANLRITRNMTQFLDVSHTSQKRNSNPEFYMDVKQSSVPRTQSEFYLNKIFP